MTSFFSKYVFLESHKYISKVSSEANSFKLWDIINISPYLAVYVVYTFMKNQNSFVVSGTGKLSMVGVLFCYGYLGHKKVQPCWIIVQPSKLCKPFSTDKVLFISLFLEKLVFSKTNFSIYINVLNFSFVFLYFRKYLGHSSLYWLQRDCQRTATTWT